jgi:TolB-like protein/DNA-binding winged helix-turn-helix (wHTH) protein
MGAPAFQFLDVTLRPSLRQLRRGGVPLALGSRAYDLLLHLVAHAGRVVPRDELMQAVWGDTVVGDNNLNVQVAALRQLLGREAVLTVPDRGLRFGHPVRACRPWHGCHKLPDRSRRWWCCRLRIWAEPRWAWFADCIVDDVTTALSRFRDLFVVARNSTLRLAGPGRPRARPARQSARTLGVRYVVEGSVRIVGTQVRASARLIDAVSGSHVWADSIDGLVDDLFAMQTRIAEGIVSALAPQIDAAEAAAHAPGAAGRSGRLRPGAGGWAVVSAGEMAFDTGPRDRPHSWRRRRWPPTPTCGLALAGAGRRAVVACLPRHHR